MEVARSSYLPGDPRLIDNIVYELKSQGIFDNFRKECISDVDTKPAYQNLRQRVEGSVIGFLKTQRWSPDMNKNQVREMLRKNISESGFLETGVERIVDQVVNPKINSIFFPQVENIVYKFLGIEKPTENSNNRTVVVVNTSNISVNDLLPNDLEAVSPDNEIMDKSLNDEKSNEAMQVEDSKIDEEESPPFEAIEESALFPPQEESSGESRLSGISDLTSHDSNQSFTTVTKTETYITNEIPQNTKNEIENQPSAQTFKSADDKMDISEEDSNSKATSDVTDSSLKKSFENAFEQVFTKDSEPAAHNGNTTENTNTTEDKSQQSDTKNSSEKHNSDKHRRSSSHRSTSRDHKKEKDRKSDDSKDRQDKHKNRHSSKSSNDRDKDGRDSKSNNKKSEGKSDKENKSDKNHGKSRHSSSHQSRDKDSKKVISDSREHKGDSKSRESVRSKSPKKDDTYKQNDEKKLKETTSKDHSKQDLSVSSKDKSKLKDKSDSKESSKRHSSDSKHSKEKSCHNRDHSKSKSESRSHHSKDRADSKGHSKNSEQIKSDDSNKNSTKKDKSHRREDKHRSRSEKHSSSDKKDKRDKDRKENKKDDHHISKQKTFNRRSTDRDSSDGHSGTHSSSSSFTESYSSLQLQKTNQDSSKINSGSNSGDSGNSDQAEVTANNEIQHNNEQSSAVGEYQHVRLIKPKFASNIFEARRLLKIRKKITKLEKQNQMKLLNNSVILNSNTKLNESSKENAVVFENNRNNKASLPKPNLKKKDDNKTKSVNPDTIQLKKSPENQKVPLKNSTSNELSNEVQPVDVIEAPLPVSVISKESWDAIEAKLNSENVLKVDYNSYVDVSDDFEEIDLSFTHKNKNANVDVKGSDINIVTNSKDKQDDVVNDAKDKQEKPSILIEETTRNEQTSEEIDNTQEDSNGSNNDIVIEVPKNSNTDGEVKYLVPEVLPETQRYFDKIANKITLLEEEIARRTKLLILHMENQKNKATEIDINRRLPKIDIVDVNTDTEIVITPSKSAKYQIKNHEDVHNNNKRKLQFEDVDEINGSRNNQTITNSLSEKDDATFKIKKVKLSANSVGDVDFSLPLSPADSDNSVSSISEKQKPNNKVSTRRSSSRTQTYASDDLYKPRLRFTSSRRRLVTNAESDSKN